MASIFTGATGRFGGFCNRAGNGDTILVPATTGTRKNGSVCVEGRHHILRGLKLGVYLLSVSITRDGRVATGLRGSSVVCVNNKGAFCLLRRLGEDNTSGLVGGRILLNGTCVNRSTKTIITTPYVSCVRSVSGEGTTPGLESYSTLSLISFCALPRVGDFPFVETSHVVTRGRSGSLGLLPVAGERTIYICNGRVGVLNGRLRVWDGQVFPRYFWQRGRFVG